MNKILLLGNVGKEPEIRVTNNGMQVMNFSLATVEKWKDKTGQQQEEVKF